MMSNVFICILVISTIAGAAITRNQTPYLCSQFSPLNTELNELQGEWITKQTLLFYNGIPIHENHPDDDFQECRALCIRFDIQSYDENTLTVNATRNIKETNSSTNIDFKLMKDEKEGYFNITGATKLTSDEGFQMMVLSGNSSNHLVVAICKPTRLIQDREEKVQVLQHLNLISRYEGRRGQSVFTINELQSQVDMLKILGSSEIQWSIPYDTTC